MAKAKDIDTYIATFPKSTQLLLRQMRAIIRNVVPDVEEAISYGMPAFRLNNRYLIYFAGYKKHIGLYPVPTNPVFIKDYAKYKTSGRGTIQFPLDAPLPISLITKIVKYRVAENRAKLKSAK